MSWSIGICCQNPIRYTHAGFCFVFSLRNEILYTFEVLPWKWTKGKKQHIEACSWWESTI